MRKAMLRICCEHKPEITFHAAAYKHGPLMESFPTEAIKNNVIALLGLLGIAQANGCRTFVLISTDKAVHAATTMGATKRIGEMILSCRPAGEMRCMFGNVLGSNGSVVSSAAGANSQW
jgi:FlaA1/EpsC-like NDP-sugar epimerase